MRDNHALHHAGAESGKINIMDKAQFSFFTGLLSTRMIAVIHF
jgi:hypothetical protein